MIHLAFQEFPQFHKGLFRPKALEWKAFLRVDRGAGVALPRDFLTY